MAKTTQKLDMQEGLNYAEFQRQNAYTAAILLSNKAILTPQAVALAEKILEKALDRLLSVELA